jgi:hypothetical protein
VVDALAEVKATSVLDVGVPGCGHSGLGEDEESDGRR